MLNQDKLYSHLLLIVITISQFKQLFYELENFTNKKSTKNYAAKDIHIIELTNANIEKIHKN